MSLLINAIRQAQIQTSTPEHLVPPATIHDQSRAMLRNRFKVNRTQLNRLPLILGGSMLGILALGSAWWWITHAREDAVPALIRPQHLVKSIDMLESRPVEPTASDTQPLPSVAAKPDQTILNKTIASPAQAPSSPSPANPPVLRHTLPDHLLSEKTSPQGFAAYAEGELEKAGQELLKTLRSEPKNIDALNAMAMIALRHDHPEEAEHYYRQALLVDPKEANARAQLALLHSEADPVTAETHLNLLLIEQPDSAPALFALGSIQARQGRWNEAQQAFFRAHTLDAHNADTLYNLAVSLDHLNQHSLAQQYYTRAATTAATHPYVFAFDPVAAQLRADFLAHVSTTPSVSGSP